MVGQAVVIPARPHVFLSSRKEGDHVYYPVNRGLWLVLLVKYFRSQDGVVVCEIIAEGPGPYHGVGFNRRIHGDAHVWELTDMEVLAWVAK